MFLQALPDAKCCHILRVCSRCIGDSTIFDEYFGSKYRSLVLAVGGENPIYEIFRLSSHKQG